LLAFPEASTAFLQNCLALFLDRPPGIGIWKAPIAVLLFALVGTEIMLLLRSAKTAGSLPLLAETVLLLALFALVPPLAAIGWYFCLWHGLRHVLRLCRYSSERKPEAGPSGALALFFYRALPFTLLSLVFLALAGLALPTAGEPARWVALYLVLISALTFPHIMLVEWMDRRAVTSTGADGR
ncbi:MAG TPA: beta-carotene 15,15'-dioxygenase, Brp/Blh family, partial [Opitutales bacterium]|nr:beta-carotene 15,15'-dioxygenase, Brp/Blh family [Opitutales bacterium]